MGSTTQGSSFANQGSSQHTAPVSAEPVLEKEPPLEGPPLEGNRGVSDIPNYPRENPLFDEEHGQQDVNQEAEAEAAPEPVFHDNPAFDQSAAGRSTLGNPLIPNRSSAQNSAQQESYESPSQLSENQVESHSGFEDAHPYVQRASSFDIPPEFDPNNPQDYAPQQVILQLLCTH